MDLREVEWEGVDWVDLVHDRVQRWVVVNTGMNLFVA
jgi:hypothetical protein